MRQGTLKPVGINMRIAIIAVPQFAQDDLEWIDRIRSRYDPQRNLVAPHFTLVFPFEGDAVDAVLKHAAHVGSQTEPLRFVLRSALAVKDTFTTSSHVFLVPDEGFSDVVALHEDLKSGHRAATAPPDIPFTPHITVAAVQDREQANAVATELNAGGVAIAGTIFALAVLGLDGNAAIEISRIELRR
jgi:2'-5' RNA ligase